MKRLVKKIILGDGRADRRIPFGLYKGLTLSIDPRSDAGFYLGLYERETTPWLRSAARSARSLVDVGAGAGELSIWALAHKSMQRVLAYDSSPERWPLLHHNIRLNAFQNDKRFEWFSTCFLGDDNPEETLLAIEALPEPVLLKIDVDGGEQAILEKMNDILRRKQFLILVETHSKALDGACFRLLADAGYRVRRIRQAWWRFFFPEQRPLDFNGWIVAARQSGAAGGIASSV